MNLILEVEFLTGVYRGTTEPASRKADWPPQPDRVFSALVAAWGAHGEPKEEQEALEWLECQEPPTIHAAAASQRGAPTVFVPPNDAKASAARDTYLRILPDRRPRRARRFPAARPACLPTNDVTGLSASLAFVWPVPPDTRRMTALERLARDVPYVGHSASLTRCRFLSGLAAEMPTEGDAAIRRVYPGRLAELVRAYRTNPVRPVIRAGASVSIAEPASATHSAREWLILEVVDERRLDLRAAAPICRLLRDALMAGYRRSGRGGSIPEVVSGHAPDGKPTRRPHLSIAPLPFVGSKYATGRIYGFAVIPPRGEELQRIPGLAAAFRRVTRYDLSRERRLLTLQGAALDQSLTVAPTADADRPGRVSLWSSPYRRPARVWATVTPIVLDRHLKKRTDAEIRGLVARACSNAGLPSPNVDDIRTGRHAALPGTPPARRHRGAPPWSRWRVPRSLASRPLVHAVIDFGEDVDGPVILGAGRFTGLGLCQRLPDVPKCN